MPLQRLRPPPFNPPKEVVANWNTFRKGWNTLVRENEVDPAEMTQSQNLMLTGSGVPTKRWGTADYFLSGATGFGRFLMPVKDATDNQQVLAMTDWGFLVKQSGSSYTPIAGASWASGYNLEGAQLGGKVYLASAAREMVRYNFSTLQGFPTLAKPTMAYVTNLSGASGSITTGPTIWSWKVTAVGTAGGETLASTPLSLTSLPKDLSLTTVRLAWSGISAAPGDLAAYNIYRGAPGDEVWIAGVDDTTTTFDDTGTGGIGSTQLAPLGDSTGGPKAKYIIRFQDRLILAGIPGAPTKILISGRYNKQERFDSFSGGGSLEIEPDSGENITGLATYYQSSTQSQTIIVFKENSVWEVTLGMITAGIYALLDPKYRLLTASQGCSSHRSIVPVENDIMFANRKGVYILRYEPQLTNVINANEISAKIRPFFESLSTADIAAAAATYVDKKYLLSFPISKQIIAFDRERLSFTGPWTLPFGINQFARYIDSGGTERWIGTDGNDQMVTEFSKTVPDDKGTVIRTIFRSRKEDFKDWTVFKTLNEVYLNFRSITGSVSINIYIEDRTGSTIVAKAFTITSGGASGTSGIGTDLMGMIPMGLTANSPEITAAETQRKAFIYKSTRTFQLEVRTTGRTDNYELLGLTAIAIPQSRGNSPSSWNV